MLRNAEKLAPIIKIDVTVIEGLAKVWIALSCGYTLDPVIFGALADEVDELMIEHVPWHPSVPSVHLNLAHGRMIMEHFFPIPYAWLDECPLESHNQLMKMARKKHTFKENRLKEMEQWFHWSLDGSDPMILEHSLADRLKLRPDPKDIPQWLDNMILWDHPYNKANDRLQMAKKS